MMAEIAGGGKERRLAIFIAAIAGDGLGGGESLVKIRMVLRVEREAENVQIVAAMLVFSKPRADDRGGNGWMF
ncbi:hypothetical protein GA0004734_00045920 [Rhizobium sp. 9140]|nr:hypothetical protein GA0004734_00045920 [Rhizobium sp. 9140]